MRWLESIRLQTGPDRTKKAQHVLNALARDIRSGGAGPDFTDAVLYRHASVPGLFVLCIWRSDSGAGDARSQAAQQIAETARGLGLVSHSVWVHDQDAEHEDGSA